MSDQEPQLPAPPMMLPRELRERFQLEDKCPNCGHSFGITDDWDDLLAKVTAHLAETGSHGAGAPPL
jgi:hypothetical protein